MENAFGYTSQVFQIYHTTIDKPPDVVNLIIQSTCVLHNMLIDMGEKDIFIAPESFEISVETLILLFTHKNDEETYTGKKVRNSLLQYFLENPIN